MRRDTLAYLEQYAKYLDQVQTEEDVYGALMEWQWAQWPARHRSVVTDINRSLGLEGLARLRPDHLPTTAVGRLDRIVVVSANPGFGAGNGREQAFRSQHQANNRRFCEHLFTMYLAETGTTAPYWTNALGVARLALDRSAKTLRGRQLWRAAGNIALGGVDLIPFHSASDGILPRLEEPGLEPIRRVAVASISMACRISNARGPSSSRLVIVASIAGTRFVEETATASGLTRVAVDDGVLAPVHPWDRLKLYEDRRGTRILTIPNQVFAGGRPRGFRSTEFARILSSYVGQD